MSKKGSHEGAQYRYEVRLRSRSEASLREGIAAMTGRLLTLASRPQTQRSRMLQNMYRTMIEKLEARL